MRIACDINYRVTELNGMSKGHTFEIQSYNLYAYHANDFLAEVSLAVHRINDEFENIELMKQGEWCTIEEMETKKRLSITYAGVEFVYLVKQEELMINQNSIHV